MKERRAQRLRKLLALCAAGPLHTQEEVVAALQAAGWPATQSSVSRDIAALHLVKVDGVYQRPERHRAAQSSHAQALSESLLSAVAAGDALVVLHTPPGEANRVALAIDRLAWPEILGTIAGDDTIFLAVGSGAAQQRVLAALNQLADGATSD